ncbi:MAG TPA: alpha-E domain-containing protein, partial [Marmoricola sp.]|nr:alpha-E domain-containing protein [Marmoricola sp.]
APDDEMVALRDLLERLAYDPNSPTSIAACLVSARESARRARETLSTSLWEVINTTYRPIPLGTFAQYGPSRLFPWVRDRAALIYGTADSTMMRDEGWQFLVLGRSIERADMTARLVAAASVASGDAWTTSLRASGGHEAFLRTQRGAVTDLSAARFLLMERQFPRSVLASLNRAEQCIANLANSGQLGVQSEAQRVLGRVRTELEYRSFTDVVTDLPMEMERLQRSCAEATVAITNQYFAGAEARLWHNGSVHDGAVMGA